MYQYWCCQCYGGICHHNTDNMNNASHIGTRYVSLAKHWMWLPDDGFMWTETCWSSFFNFNYFNNLSILQFVCISWTIKCLILLMHGANVRFTGLLCCVAFSTVSRKCFNLPNLFGYVCVEFTTKSQRKFIKPVVKKAYELYFGCKVGDQIRSGHHIHVLVDFQVRHPICVEYGPKCNVKYVYIRL